MITQKIQDSELWPCPKGVALGFRLLGHDGVGSKIRLVSKGIAQVFTIYSASKGPKGDYLIIAKPEE